VPSPRTPFRPFTPEPGDTSVELRLSPSAAWVAEYYPCEEVVRTDTGDLQVRVRFRDLAVAQRLVLGLGPSCEVLGPAHLAGQVRQAARDALACYASTPPASSL
jgi:proteasome accessory factor C